ncbi:MAG: sulfotransferase domain-containing protein [Microcoleaceae cyanobacterium]
MGLSLYNHYRNRIWETKTPEVQVPDHFSDFWDRWIETGEPGWSFWEHINSWWQVINLPNILFVHYSNLINEKNKEVGRIASFLEIELDENLRHKILHRSSLEYMKNNWQKFEPIGRFNPQTFINQGNNGRWQNLLSNVQL